MKDQDLILKIREETAPAFENGNVDVSYIYDQCPRLFATFNEAIRISAFSASVRFVQEDTIIGQKRLRKGNRLMIPYRQLHFDEAAFGSRVFDFDSERFLDHPDRLKSSSWRPFGGGSTQCPGRFAARQAVMLFVAVLLRRYEIQANPGQPSAEPENQRPVLGIMGKKEGTEDLLVKLTLRT